MNILQVCQTHPPEFSGGSTVYTLKLAHRLYERGHNITVLCNSSNPALHPFEITTSQEPFYDLIRMGRPSGRSYGPEHLKHIVAVTAGILEEHRIELINFHSAPDIGEGIIEAACRCHVPIVVTAHDGWWICPNLGFRNNLSGNVCNSANMSKCLACRLAIMKSRESSSRLRIMARLACDCYWCLKERCGYLNRATHLVANCDFIKRQYHSFGVSIPMSVIKNKIDEQLILPKPVADAHRPLRFGAFGVFRKNKGGGLLLEALRQMVDANLSFEFHVWGPVYDEVLHVSKGDMQLPLVFHGAYEREQLNDIFAQIDVLVLASPAESLPMVLLEALASRTPIVAARSHGMLELVQEKRNGRFFEALQPESLRDALVWFLEKPSRVPAMQAQIEPPLPYAELLDAYEEVYDRVMHQSQLAEAKSTPTLQLAN